jgi:hypothetical protein
MNTLINLLKDRQIGMWCKRAAWIILVIGLVEIVFNIYNYARSFAGQPFTPVELIQLLGYSLAVLPSILFYFFILYAAGAVVNHVVGTQEMDDETEEDQDIALPQ